MTSAPSEDSDQCVHLHSLISLRTMKVWVLSTHKAQADLSLRCGRTQGDHFSLIIFERAQKICL